MRTLHHLEASDLDLHVRLFENANVHTLNAHTLVGERPEAFLTVGNTIAATGTSDECLQVALACGYRNIERVDLGGATVLPGFVDPHAHPLMHGQMLSWVDCGPERAGSIAEIVALL